MRKTIITVNASSFSEIFPFYGQIPSPGDEVVVSVVRGGKTDKRETFLSAFYCLESRDKDTDRYWLLDTLP